MGEVDMSAFSISLRCPSGAGANQTHMNRDTLFALPLFPLYVNNKVGATLFLVLSFLYSLFVRLASQRHIILRS